MGAPSPYQRERLCTAQLFHCLGVVANNDASADLEELKSQFVSEVINGTFPVVAKVSPS